MLEAAVVNTPSVQNRSFALYGIPKEYFEMNVVEEVRIQVEKAIDAMKNMGAIFKPVRLPLTSYGSLVYAIVAPSEISSNLARYDGIRYGHVTNKANNLEEVYSLSRAEGFGNEAKRRIMTGSYVLSAGYYDAYYKKAQKVRRLIVNEFNQVFDEVDVLIAPSVPTTAPLIGKASEDPLFGYVVDRLNIPSSLAGLPAISIPYGLSSEEKPMPIGVQLIAPQYQEQRLLNIGHALQVNSDYHLQFPKV